MRFDLYKLEEYGVKVCIEENDAHATLTISGTDPLPEAILDCIDRLYGKLNQLHGLTSSTKEDITSGLAEEISSALILATMKKARIF